MDVLNFFYVQYCVNTSSFFFKQSKTCIYFLECHLGLCFLLYVMLPVFYHTIVHTSSEEMKTKLTENYFDTSVEFELDVPLCLTCT